MDGQRGMNTPDILMVSDIVVVASTRFDGKEGRKIPNHPYVASTRCFAPNIS